ncbi:MAG: SulP family inorganic anion transporter, partial [Romboutsia sp.]|nr:SulP family inorganic anion transporter [Romboutsia sp.]
PAIFVNMYKAGWKQFVPFILTIIGVVVFDLLTGISIGIVAALFVIIYKSYQNTHFTLKEEEGSTRITLAEELTFFNKSPLLDEFARVPDNSHVVIDKTNNVYLDYDVAEIIEDFKLSSKERNITLEIIEK